MPFDASTAWPVPGLTVQRAVFQRGVIEVSALERHSVALYVGEPVEVDCACDGVRYRGLQTPGSFDISPAGACGRWEDSAEVQAILVSLTPDFLAARARANGVDARHLSLPPQFQLSDPPLTHVMSALALASEAWPEAEPLLIESLAEAFGARILSRYCADGPAPPRLQRLSARQKRRVLAYIEDNLAQRLTLADIANTAGLSASHLKVLFRRSMGLPVHKYVMQRRVELAARLVRQGATSLSDIAAAAGFAHQSHMARCMRQLLGVTPSALARQSGRAGAI